jgi:hypothetical protein
MNRLTRLVRIGGAWMVVVAVGTAAAQSSAPTKVLNPAVAAKPAAVSKATHSSASKAAAGQSAPSLPASTVSQTASPAGQSAPAQVPSGAQIAPPGWTPQPESAAPENQRATTTKTASNHRKSNATPGANSKSTKTSTRAPK